MLWENLYRKTFDVRQYTATRIIMTLLRQFYAFMQLVNVSVQYHHKIVSAVLNVI